MDLGFVMSKGTITTLISVFVIYSIIVVGLGFYIQFASRKDSADKKIVGYLTGGGGLGTVATAMLIFTGLTSAGGAIGGPGTGYSVGYTWSVAVWSGLSFGCLVPFTFGKKLAIVAKRTHAMSFVSLFNHRYGNSKLYAMILSAILTIFFGAMVIGQFSGGGKVFATISGGSQVVGVLIFAAVTIIYSMAGGVKSIARVAVIQGFAMFLTTFFLFGGTVARLTADYGSFQQAIEWLSVNNPKLVVAETWTPLYMGGTALLMSTCISYLPTGVIGCFTYKNANAIVKGGILTIIVTTIYQFVMSGMGPLTYAMSQAEGITLASGDFTTVYSAVTVLPDVLAGLVVAAAASAIQSTIASILVIVTGSIVIDVYKTYINPEAPAKRVSVMMKVVTVVFGLICMCIAFKPTPYVQMFINFTVGGMCSGLAFPMLFAVYSRKANKEGAIAATVFGALTYGVIYFCQNLVPAFASWYKVALNNAHPVIFGCLVSLIIMLVSMKVGKPMEKGRLQVWFNEDYEEEWACK